MSPCKQSNCGSVLGRNLPSDFTSWGCHRVHVDVGVPVTHQDYERIERDSRARGIAGHEDPVNSARLTHGPIVRITEALNDSPVDTHRRRSVNMGRRHVSDARDVDAE